jgi:hypothetical protein
MDEDIKRQLLSLSFINNRVQEKRSEQCWVDGSNCPYGRPEGQFALRPKNFCRPKNNIGGCIKLNDHSGDVFEAFREEMPESLSDWLSKNKPISISDLLSGLAEETILDDDEKVVIKAVIAILKNGIGLDEKIFRAEDLCDQ